jgi:hypothetical protein
VSVFPLLQQGIDLALNGAGTAYRAGAYLGALKSSDFTGFNDAFIMEFGGREGSEPDMGRVWILPSWPEWYYF